MANDNRFLVDMVGIMKNKSPIVQSSKNDQNEYHLKFEIVDGGQTTKVTLFDKFALEVDQRFSKATGRDVIVIISCARVTRYDENNFVLPQWAGEPQLTNYPATRIYIEPDHYCGTRISASFRWGDEMETPVMTVMQIKSLQLKDIEEQVNCEIVVTKVVNRNKWYTIFCSNCTTKIAIIAGIIKCPDCKRLIPYPRRSFNIKTECSDGSGSIEVMFSDEDVCRIIGKKVDDIYCPQAEAKGEQFFPDILNQLVRQKYVITLSITKHNIENSSTVYDATNVGECIESIGNTTHSHRDSIMEPMSISKVNILTFVDIELQPYNILIADVSKFRGQ
ncbi:uncharacterized protein LOC141704488, partial [Apium graveolens]|uniref:uncharacterized protein LOC141704488 n=1 Tax=Apium graveolens TaxID=4045 RepID=UPI003D79A996